MKFLVGLILTLTIITPFFEHSEADTQLLADVMWLENGSTGYTKEDNKQCLILTGAVVLNRARSGEWGGTSIYDVIYAKGQYAYETKKNIGKCKTPQYVIDLAEEILTYGTNVPDYVVYQSTQKNLGTVWKIIEYKPNEYFATDGGYYMKGKDFVAKTNKEQYEEQVRQSIRKIIRQWNKSLNKLLRKLQP